MRPTVSLSHGMHGFLMLAGLQLVNEKEKAKAKWSEAGAAGAALTIPG